MAILNSTFLSYINTLMQKSLISETIPLYHDPLLMLAEYCLDIDKVQHLDFLTQWSFSSDQIGKAKGEYKDRGIIGMSASYFKNSILNQFVNHEIERKVIALKSGLPKLPATKASTILKGFGFELTVSEVLNIYASHGLTQGARKMGKHFDFKDINRRAARLDWLMDQPPNSDEIQNVQNRYLAVRAYLTAPNRQGQKAIANSKLNRGQFFHYWRSFKIYGFLGLIDKGKEVFRSSKTGLENEAKIVIDKLQYPSRPESFYVSRLKTRGIEIDRSTVAKILAKWKVAEYKSAFVSNLERLEKSTRFAEEELEMEEASEVSRYVDRNFLILLKKMSKTGVYVDAPGILVLWAYLEELGIYQKVKNMGLTYTEDGKGYDWFDHFLINIARIFYGISTYSPTCDHQEPTLSLFSHLVALPCNGSFLNGLSSISEEHVFELQGWLIKRSKTMGFVKGERLAFDFNQIDLDVELPRLRGFGKGPSPKKKICYDGFRPHIAWDVDTGNVVIVEFRKGSARGTTTVKRFVRDFILTPFKGLFNKVYVDSEYTGKDVWNFVLDSDTGMGAEITACIKQNPFVKKKRDEFLLENGDEDDFWVYYDDDHVYSSKTFTLSWDFKGGKNNKQKKYSLNCVVKKNIKNGKLRCFGTSEKGRTSRQILKDYSNRWTIEIGIKDLIHSYYLSNCPGKIPHSVNVHFFMVTVCRQLYQIIQRDLGDDIKNKDQTVKTLKTMRETLFRQGSAKVLFRKNAFVINHLNSYSPKRTSQLNKFYNIIHERTSNGLEILGGARIKFELKPPKGPEHRNSMKKVPLIVGKKTGHPKNKVSF